MERLDVDRRLVWGGHGGWWREWKECCCSLPSDLGQPRLIFEQLTEFPRSLILVQAEVAGSFGMAGDEVPAGEKIFPSPCGSFAQRTRVIFCGPRGRI